MTAPWPRCVRSGSGQGPEKWCAFQGAVTAVTGALSLRDSYEFFFLPMLTPPDHQKKTVKYAYYPLPVKPPIRHKSDSAPSLRKWYEQGLDTYEAKYHSL